jgi:transmembrane sensor
VTSTPPDTSTAPSASSPKPAPKLTADWRSLARNQDFARAYDALRSGPPDVRDEPQDLLLASDVARLSKHPEEALAPLRKILRDHRKDSRAPVAAFTLGRVLLQDLKRPGEAADAFADARALDPNGTLAEDALAREVESAALTGDAARARTRAEEYVTRYPNGARVGSVKRHGGIP